MSKIRLYWRNNKQRKNQVLLSILKLRKIRLSTQDLKILRRFLTDIVGKIYGGETIKEIGGRIRKNEDMVTNEDILRFWIKVI